MGPGRAWSFDPDFVLRDMGRPAVPLAHGQQQRPPAEPAITVAGTVIGKKAIHKHRQAVSQEIDRDRVLLPTGVINIDHPPVVAWLKTNRKKSKQHG